MGIKILEALKYNKTILILKLEGNGIDSEILNEIEKSIKII